MLFPVSQKTLHSIPTTVDIQGLDNLVSKRGMLPLGCIALFSPNGELSYHLPLQAPPFEEQGK